MAKFTSLALLALLATALAASMNEPHNLIEEESLADGSTRFTVTWTHLNPQYPTLVAHCGDEVVFKWAGGSPHNVGVAVDGDCNEIMDPSPTATSGEEAYVLPSDATEVYYACAVGSHCVMGQILEVLVECGGLANGTAPAPAPWAMP